jgi:Tfp pilus assembly protein PilF
VSHLLEGSVRRSGNLVRVTAQLIDTASGTHLWSDRYDGDLSDIFALQDEIAGKVVAQVGIAIGRDATHLVSEQRRPANAEAHELYLQALYFSKSGNPYEVEKAIPLFQQAVALDPEFADAWTELGATYFSLNQNLYIPVRTNPIAIHAFETALAIDPEHAGAMLLLGYLRITHDYAWSEGLSLMARAAALAPQNAAIQGAYGRWLRMTRHEEADTILARASRLDPLAYGPIIDRATMMVHEGQFDESVELMETALIRHRDKYQANAHVALFNWGAQRLDRAEEYLEQARAIVGSDFASIRLLDWKIAAARGDLALANGIKAEVKERAKHTRVANLVDAGGDWSQSEYLEMFELAIEQRHGEVLIPLLYKRHWMVAKSDWDRLQNSIRFSEVEFGNAGALGANFQRRSSQEREQLLSSAIPVSEETLQSYTGTFERQDDGLTRRVVLDGNQLKYIQPSGEPFLMIPTGTHRFGTLEYKGTVEFILVDDKVHVMRWIERGALTHDAVKVDTPNLR